MWVDIDVDDVDLDLDGYFDCLRGRVQSQFRYSLII